MITITIYLIVGLLFALLIQPNKELKPSGKFFVRIIMMTLWIFIVPYTIYQNWNPKK